MVHYFFYSGEWGHDPRHRLIRAGIVQHNPKHAPSWLLHCPLPCPCSGCRANSELTWAWHVLLEVQQKAGFTEAAENSLLKGFGGASSGVCSWRQKAGTAAAYVCAWWQRKPSLNPPTCRTISEHKIYHSAVTQHQALAFQRMPTDTLGAWHADLPPSLPEIKCHNKKL